MALTDGIEALRAKWQAVKLQDIALQIAADNEKDIADILREQLYSGFNAKGEKLKRYKDAEYAAMKNAMNPAAGLGNPDTFLTGEFHKSIFADTDTGRKTIFFDATDEKVIKLVGKYGLELLDLSPDSNVRVWVEVMRDKAVKRVADITGATLK